MIWDKIEIKFNIGKFPISFRIPRNFYLKSKTIFENFISSLYNLNFNKNDKRESILLLELKATRLPDEEKAQPEDIFLSNSSYQIAAPFKYIPSGINVGFTVYLGNFS